MEKSLETRDALAQEKKDQAAKPVTHPFIAMLGMLIGGFVGMLSETSLNIALPSLMTALHVNIGTIQWLVTGYMLIIGIVLPLSSLLSRIFSTRQIIVFAIIAFIVGAIISALASSFPVLLIGRMIQGIGTGLILPLMFTVATLIFPPYKLGAAMGLIGLVIMFAPAIGPTLSGMILGILSWQWIFWMFVPFLIVALILVIKYLPNVGHITKPKIDVFSIILSTLGFGGLVTGVSLASDQGWGSPTVIATLIAAIILLAWYIKRQLSATEPILNFHIFAIRQYRTGAILVMMDFGIILSSMYLLPMFWQNGLAIPVALTGIVMLPGGIVNAAVSAIAGRYSDLISKRLLSVSGFAMTIIGIVLFLFANSTSPIWYVILAHIVMMIGVPLSMSPSQTFGLSALDQRTSSDGSTIMNTFQQIVGAIATAIATALLGFGQQLSATTHQIAFTNGVHLGFIFTLIIAVAALLLSLTMKERKIN
ncbi:putative transport protein HsrA [Lentilactobacillus hilgardii]|uniref:Drug resistance MFS transporter, drug:H+ antiporter-2 family n=1 Tax=Lentilactobacillus hilgardii (strain ATCC 8290 / DSM 20176 / CCUG 30140 / JCM 1155 / KCTC 3500 / NBRC 15886 / NCIMB 8040 / NRRL B-1843 / 9) TaxID=1423757 RepID=C0XIV3_LENH9|nr:DHA2 family efflux MFS transporter permease subunit [Lentilactobacillus hilgardii]EEI20853.1 drug resistance MFS transporter, drug:H+ antiporter-2 family [Lentilactobacillus buchneri ATCC 11577]EEI24694.1 drug resistance MFS transporter, drug:H+ antiporter-2 family [Lentilactobacillus hilgardii DSM 20176 = ATCC 8290]KRK57572.1 MFS family major facilitator transporter [Lentilactobacillus hilgardii DSM 20176 = ATCC 8290]MCT3395105.1 DHA2 family efflux MFS transporter permease subunit [Lentilac